MAGGLIGLLDDVAALAKLAAASVDDVGMAASRASVKAAGVVVDDTAVTPAYVHGLAAERELPIIKRIAVGSIRNKLLFILPAALLLSQFVPILVEIILMIGGAYLCFEGAEKLHHRFGDHLDEVDVPAVALGEDAEAKTIAGAIRTDFILSGEIMVIALKEVIDESFISRAAIMVVVAIVITAVVYGVVAAIVKMDDVGLHLATNGGSTSRRFGRGLVAGMPKLLNLLSTVGTAAMLWVGGHILLVGAHELGWDAPYDFVHSLEESVHDVGGIGGVLAWIVNTMASAVLGIAAGFLVMAVVSRLPIGNKDHASRRRRCPLADWPLRSDACSRQRLGRQVVADGEADRETQVLELAHVEFERQRLTVQHLGQIGSASLGMGLDHFQSDPSPRTMGRRPVESIQSRGDGIDLGGSQDVRIRQLASGVRFVEAAKGDPEDGLAVLSPEVSHQ